MKAIKKLKEHMKTIPFFMGCYNFYYKLRFGGRIKRKKKYFLKEAVELLQHFSQVLNDNNVQFWLEFGTLLGYYREHDFIKHDYDLDVGVFLSDSEKIRKILTDNGFKLVREFRAKDGGLEECYRYMHTTIDVFYFNIDENNPEEKYCDLVKCSVFPIKKKHLNKELKAFVRRRYVPNNGVEKAVFKGSDIYIPRNPEEVLTIYYGKNFMVPDPKFNAADFPNKVIYYSYEENPGISVFKELPL